MTNEIGTQMYGTLKATAKKERPEPVLSKVET